MVLSVYLEPSGESTINYGAHCTLLYMIWKAELGGAGAGGALYHHLPFLPAEAAGKLNLEVTLQQCTNSR